MDAQNKLFSVEVKTENRKMREHTFVVTLEFCHDIHEDDARNWLQRMIAKAAESEYVQANTET